MSLGLIDPASGERWLFEATPDLPEQLRHLNRIAPRDDKPGLDGIFLTHAHVGHYTGLMLLGHEVMGANGAPVYVMPRMASFLRENGPWSQLVTRVNITLREITAGVPSILNERIAVTPLRVPHRQEFSEVVGFRIEGPNRSVLFIPDIDSWEEWEEDGTRIEDEIGRVAVAYLDATFYANGEIPGRHPASYSRAENVSAVIRKAPRSMAAVRASYLYEVVILPKTCSHTLRSPSLRMTSSGGFRFAERTSA